VRALAALLPAVSIVRGCRFACDPAAPDPACPDGPHATDSPGGDRAAALVELPVGATAAQPRLDKSDMSVGEGRAAAVGRAFRPRTMKIAVRGTGGHAGRKGQQGIEW
jgi:magnesium chelatase subunit D